MKIIEGNLVAKDLRFGIVVSRFNSFISTKLLEGATDAIQRHGGLDHEIEIAWVPGAFEIPLIADQMAASGLYDAIITLGVIIRGSTDHYEYVCKEVASGISTSSIRHHVPVLFGVLTVETIEQAIERAGTKAGNKGWDVAMAAIEMGNLQKQLKSVRKL